jgi:N-acylneuraminate cytidylyltransferase
MRLAVIPARGGSQRIPRKNILPFCGRPMIAWPITAALDSGLFDAVVVSTDDPEIAEVARAHGATTPFLRPAELADHHTGTAAVVVHAIRWHQAQGLAPDKVCCLYATAPFVQAADLQRGLQMLDDPAVDYAIAITSFGFPIQRALRRLAGGGLGLFQPEHAMTRSQDLEEAFHDAGQFYWGRSAAWLEDRPDCSPASRPVLLQRHRVQDIDTPEDWLRAEWMFRAMRDGAKPD